jgi:hypothetical protein
VARACPAESSKATAVCEHSTAANRSEPIYAASLEGHSDIVNLLIAAGARVDAATEALLHLLSLQVPRTTCCCSSLILSLAWHVTNAAP